MDSRLLVERAVAELAEASDIFVPASRRGSPRQLVGALEKAGILDEDIAKLVMDIYAIQNGVA